MNTSIEHIRLLNDLAKYCENQGLTIFEHKYRYLAFGSWSLIIGKDKDRMMFSWDGKESYLGVGKSNFQNSNSSPNWEPVFPSIGGINQSEASVFSFIKKQLKKQYVI